MKAIKNRLTKYGFKSGSFDIDFLRTTVTVMIDKNWHSFLSSKLTNPEVKKQFELDRDNMAGGSTIVEEGESHHAYICGDKKINRNILLHECTHLFFQLAYVDNLRLDEFELTAHFGAYLFDNVLKIWEKIK